MCLVPTVEEDPLFRGQFTKSETNELLSDSGLNFNDLTALFTPHLFHKNALGPKNGGLILKAQYRNINIALIVNCFHQFIPFVGRPLLITGVRLCYIITASVCRGKKWAHVVLKCFLVRSCEGLEKANEKCDSLEAVFRDAVANFFIGLELFLNIGFVTTVNKNSLPYNLLCIHIGAITMHKVIKPLAFIVCPVCKLHRSLAIHFALLPLPSVNSTARELLAPMSAHLIVHPVTFVLLQALAA